MFAPVDTRNAAAVETHVLAIHRDLFPDGDSGFVKRAFHGAGECFGGRHADYQAVDARYHDFEHTLQGTLCLARLLQGRHHAGAQPAVPRHLFELGLLAILLHDSGYLKKRGDDEGTGAKYTVTHVARSMDFAREFLGEQGYGLQDIESVQHMISCTGVNASLDTIPFRTELDRLLGYALGTADLLGQMAAADYVDKLPVLYLEFAEAARHDGRRAARLAAYTSPEELMRNTPNFWNNYVMPRLNEDFGGLYRFLNHPYPDGPNEYLDRIAANLARLETQLAGR